MAKFFDIRGLASKIVAISIGTLTITSAVILGASARFTGHLIPSSNNVYDIGSPTSSWRNLYASGTAMIASAITTKGNLQINKTNAELKLCAANGGSCFNILNDGGGSMRLGGPAYTGLGITDTLVYSYADFRPTSNNLRDLGSATLGWKDFYASGTAYILSGQFVHVTSTHYVSGLGTHTAPAYGFNGYGGGIWSGGADLRLVTDDLIVRNIANSGTALRVSGGVTTFNTLLVAGANNSQDIGAFGTSWKNLYATGTEIVFAGIKAPPVTADFVCWSATGTLRHATVNCTVSSERFKTNIEEMDDEEMAAKIKALQPIQYNWKEGAGDPNKVEEGFSAEKVAMIDPSLVAFEETEDLEWIAFMEKNYPLAIVRKDGKIFVPKTVDYARISVILTGGFQYLDRKLNQQQREINELKAMLIQQ